MNRRRSALDEQPPNVGAQRQSSTVGQTGVVSRGRRQRFVRYVVQRIAILLALLILFYATSLHGVSIRTFILAGALVLFLYWVFKDLL